MNKLRVGVIGCGSISTTHTDAISKSNNATLVLVCDNNEERAKKLADRHHCDYTVNYKELLHREDIDVVHVLTPHYLHYPIAMEALQKGKHCLIEKPVTIKRSDAKALHNQIQSSGCKCSVSFQNRFNPTSQKIRELIDQNTYGCLKGIRGSVTWFRDAAYYNQDAWRGKWDTEGGGVLINQAIHTLDLIQWFGGTIKSISGNYGTYGLKGIIEVEDTATVFFKFKSGAKGTLFATNNHATNSPIELELVFEQGSLLLMEGKLYEKTNGLKLIAQDDIVDGEKAYWGLSHERLIEHFYQSILDNSDEPVKVKDAAQSIAILEQFYQKANTGEWLTIENTKEWE